MSLQDQYLDGSFDVGLSKSQPSPTLLQPTGIDKITIGEFLAGLRRRWLPALVVGIIAATGYLTHYFLFRRSYQHTAFLQVDAIRPLGGRPGTGMLSANLESTTSSSAMIDAATSDANAVLQVLNSDLVLRPIYERLITNHPTLNGDNYSYQAFRQNIRIATPGQRQTRDLLSRPGAPKIIQVSFSANDKEIVRFGLETIINELMNFNTSEKQERIVQNLRYVNQEIQRTLSQIDELEDQLNDFRRQNQVLRPDAVSGESTSDASLYQSELARLMTAKNENDTKLGATRQTVMSLESQLRISPAQGLALSNLNASPTYTSLLARLADIDKQLAEALSNFQANSPMVRTLEQQRRLTMAQLQQQIQQVSRQQQVMPPNPLTSSQGALEQQLLSDYIRAKVELDSLERIDTELSRQITAARQELDRMTRLANPYRKIEQRMRAAQQSLQLLLQTRQSLQLQIAQQDFTWKLLSDINDFDQYELTQRLRNALLIALAVGGFAGIVLAVTLELLDSRFLEVSQVRQTTSLPIVGEIPLTQSFEQYTFNRLETPLSLWGLEHRFVGASASFKECFYFLLNHLEQLGLQRSLAITSAEAGEGRTTLAVYLAVAAAAAGKRVLLVDGHLRQPKLHQLLDIPNTSGLSDLLTETVPPLNWPRILTCRSEKLWVLTAGQPQQEPMSLLSSPQWHSFLASTQAAFDLVIIDTAPMVECAETNRLVASVDQALFVVRLGTTKRDAFAKALKEYDLGLKDKAIGIVVNGVQAPKQGEMASLPVISSPVHQSAAVS